MVTWPNGVRSHVFSNISHPFVSIASEGRATVDLVRAARTLASLEANVKWLAIGQSQGGHAALATAEVVADEYDTEMTLIGVVAGAPASELDSPHWWADEVQNAVFGMMAASLPLEWRDLRASRYLSDQAMMIVSHVTNRICFNQSTLGEVVFNNFLVPPAYFFKRWPWSDAAVLAALRANSPGRRPFDVPVFVGQVRGDPFISHMRTDSFLKNLHDANRALVTYCEYEGPAATYLPPALRVQNHNAFGPMFAPEVQLAPNLEVTPARWGCKRNGQAIQTDDARHFVSRLYADALANED
jgi:hypothetical protein